MKITSIKKTLGSIALLGVFTITPALFAANASTTASVRINEDGIVHIVNAEITSISGNVIQAITHFKNNVANWTFTTNASTTIAANNTKAASTTDLKIGDRLNVTGALATLGSTISVSASKIMDLTSYLPWKTTSGTVKSINTSNGTFILMSGDKLITVQTNASTTFALKSSASTTTTLSSLVLNTNVKVFGTITSDGTDITATKVIAKTTENKDNKNKEKKDNNGKDNGLKNGWKDKEDRDNTGKHEGFLKKNLNIGLEIGDN